MHMQVGQNKKRNTASLKIESTFTWADTHLELNPLPYYILSISWLNEPLKYHDFANSMRYHDWSVFE